MKQLDLDRLIVWQRLYAKENKTIDIDDKFDDISIFSILSDIYENAMSLPDIDKTFTVSSDAGNNYDVVKSISAKESRGFLKLKSYDSALQKISIYRNTIRPTLKTKILSYYNGKIIDGRELLKYDGENFVKIVYRSILEREVDELALKNSIELLINPSSDKLDLINGISKSQEALNKNIRVTGLFYKNLKLNIKRAILSIPILGYIIRVFVNVICLPKRIRNIQTHLNNLDYYSIRELQNFSTNLAKENSKLQNKVFELSEHNYDLDIEFKGLYGELGVIKEWYNSILYNENIEKQKRIYEKNLLDKIYYDYENTLMKKDHDSVKKENLPYLERFNKWSEGKNKSQLKIVDLGCGSGVWIEQLIESGYSPIGVDSNDLIVDEAIEKRALPIIKYDAIDYLKNSEDESIDVISSFQMIEHLEINILYDFFDECKRVLKKGGLLILATPNPENILTATYMFRVDPTHKNPIPIEVLEFYMKEWGFDIWDSFKLKSLDYFPFNYESEDPMRHVAFRFNMEQEYSVWAVKV